MLKKKFSALQPYTKKQIQQTSKQLYVQIAALINSSKEKIASSVNQELTLLNWHIGKHIDETLQNTDEHYGLEIVATLSPLLIQQFGKGYTTSSLHRVRRFYKAYQKIKIVATLSPLLSWSHFIELTNVKNDLARSYYTELCKIEHWNVRELRGRINSMLYERTALSKKPEKLIKQEIQQLKSQKKFTENIVFRDAYILDFLDLKDVYSEKDLETAILVELQKFIIEIGTDFAFLARQKRMIIDGEDFSLDLLFYHRGLNRLVAIELKLGKFKHSYKSQMELYLRWLEKYEMRIHEELPIGLILCADNDKEIMELLMIDEKRIRVANYLTEMPEAKIIKQKLQKAISNAKAKFNNKK
jgi:predicted nuclease of restriction endonuclease-like (RecB) superfamily